MKRILVTGSRKWTDKMAVLRTLNKAVGFLDPDGDPYDVIIVHGGADGADELADQVAVGNGWHIEEYEYDPMLYEGDPRNRNTYMVDLGADLCVAFYIPPIGRKGGTRDCYEKAITAG